LTVLAEVFRGLLRQATKTQLLGVRKEGREEEILSTQLGLGPWWEHATVRKLPAEIVIFVL
jgi:hypothetical protein